MRRVLFLQVSIAFLLCYTHIGQVEASLSLTAPPLEKVVPKKLEWSKDYKLPKKARKQNLGFRKTSGVEIEKQQGVFPIYLAEVFKKVLPGDDLQVGDVLVAINGKALRKKPIGQYREALSAARKGPGFLWLTRWRDGLMERVFLDLGSRPLDLTQTGKPGSTRDWRLGPLGANGWCYHERAKYGASAKARQIYITAIDAKGPSAGELEVGDVILGAYGKPFSIDARKALAAAIDLAESEEKKGVLELLVWRFASKDQPDPAEGKEIEVKVSLPVMGSYNKTMPYDCDKTEKIIDEAVAHMIKNKDTLLKPGGWINYMNGLGLLATGREDVLAYVKEQAHGSLLKEGETLSVEKHVSMMCWWWSYKTIFMCEYYLRTGDKVVLPTILEYGTKISMGQSGAGTWGHTYAAKENTGYLNGHLGGYGAINQQGLTLMIALALVEKCGITNDEIKGALKRGTDFFSFFIGKGTIPYGDHGAASGWYDDNGKSGAAAIYFDLIENKDGPEFFSKMVLASAPSGRESGHTGHFWSRLWGAVGAARGGDQLTQSFFKEINWAYTLERQPDGWFSFQDNAGENGSHGDPKTKWDSTGSRLLQLCLPRRATYITGKGASSKSSMSEKRVDEVLNAGKLYVDREAQGKLSLDEILELLKDPLPPTRAIGASILASREINCVDQLMEMLDSKNRFERYGAAEGLEKAGFGNQAAANKLIKLMAEDDDIQFKTYAIAALINRDKEKGLLTVARPAIPVLMKMALEHHSEDPRKVLQHDIGRALFYNGSAQPRRGLFPEYGVGGIDRSLLLDVIKEILTNENGWVRSTCVSFIYPKLSKAELSSIWGDVYMATRHIAPSGIMFASGARTEGLKLMSKHRIAEGLPLAVWYIRYQKGHGSSGRIPTALKAIESYGSHAKSLIPELENHAIYFEKKAADKRRRRKSKPQPNDPDVMIRKTIEKLKSTKDAKFELVSISKDLKKKGISPQ